MMMSLFLLPFGRPLDEFAGTGKLSSRARLQGEHIQLYPLAGLAERGGETQSMW